MAGIRMLINDLQAKLQNTRIAGRQNASDCCRADVADRVSKIGMIQRVEKLGAKLQIHALPYMEAAEYRAVQVVTPRSDHRVAAEVAELAQRRGVECRGVEIL